MNKEPLTKASILFKQLPSQVFIRAMSNSTEESLSKEYASILGAIRNSFSWENSPEGFMYWQSQEMLLQAENLNRIANRFLSKITLPPLASDDLPF